MNSLKNLITLFKLYIFEIFVREDSEKRRIMENPFNRNIEESISFTIENTKEFLTFLPSSSSDYLKNKTILEIGPGQNIGFALLIMGFGIKNYYIIDRFFYHQLDEESLLYYKSLLNKAKIEFPEINFKELELIIKKASFHIPNLHIINKSLEETNEIPHNSIDISFSNACFEHLYDTEKAINNLQRMTISGGLGFHQVDFRDHRDFDKPLEFLTMSNFMFNQFLTLSKACHGNRVRPFEFIEIFEANNFITEFRTFQKVDDTYLKKVKKYFIKKYRQMDDEKLRPLSGRFYIEKK